MKKLREVLSSREFWWWTTLYSILTLSIGFAVPLRSMLGMWIAGGMAGFAISQYHKMRDERDTLRELLAKLHNLKVLLDLRIEDSPVQEIDLGPIIRRN